VIKFYADENFHIDFVRQLQQFGYDVLTCFECGKANQSIPDSEVLAFAISENRVLLTMNRDDFWELHQQINHCGIVICKEDKDDLGQAIVLHEYLISKKLPDLFNICLRIKKQNSPKSNLQIFVVTAIR
jgi:predicted nuclease of predicted toxin-antitoxin system